MADGERIQKHSDCEISRAEKPSSDQSVQINTCTQFATHPMGHGKMIATGGSKLRIWNTDTGELFKTILKGFFTCLAWASGHL